MHTAQGGILKVLNKEKVMKKLVLSLMTAFVVAAGPAMAADTYFKPGSLVAQVGVGYGWGLGVEGGADLSLGQWVIAPVLPLDYGVGARVGFRTGFLTYGAGVGAEGHFAVHYSWKALGTGMDFVNRLESYTGIGVQLVPADTIPVYLSELGGTSYHLDNNLAIEIGYYSITGGGTLGLTYRF